MFETSIDTPTIRAFKNVLQKRRRGQALAVAKLQAAENGTFYPCLELLPNLREARAYVEYEARELLDGLEPTNGEIHSFDRLEYAHVAKTPVYDGGDGQCFIFHDVYEYAPHYIPLVAPIIRRNSITGLELGRLPLHERVRIVDGTPTIPLHHSHELNNYEELLRQRKRI